jgi:hypothetical protein
MEQIGVHSAKIREGPYLSSSAPVLVRYFYWWLLSLSLAVIGYASKSILG